MLILLAAVAVLVVGWATKRKLDQIEFEEEFLKDLGDHLRRNG